MKTPSLPWSLCLLLSLVAPTTAQTVILRVDGDAGGGDGSGWGANALRHLQDALDLAQNASGRTRYEIWVAKTDPMNPYRVDQGANYTPGDDTVSFRFLPFTAVYGGFLGTDHPELTGGETSLDERDPKANETVLTAELSPNEFETTNAFHVIVGNPAALDENSRYDGFTICGGRAIFGGDNGRGGGIFFRSGIQEEGGNPVVANCLITDNFASIDGGGYYSDGLFGATILTSFVSTTIAGNNAGLDGGGASSGLNSNERWVNCVVSSNVAGRNGGGVSLRGGTTQPFVNCTVVDNIAVNLGGGGYIDQAQVAEATVIDNAILWGNQDSTGFTPQAQLTVTGPALVTVNFTDLMGGWSGAGVGNIDQDPLFWGAATGNYRLTGFSPCLDVANTAAVPLDEFDVNDDGITAELTPDRDRNARDIDDFFAPDGVMPFVDLGAYEYCRYDTDGDGEVGVTDLLVLLGAWGPNPGHPADFDLDGDVDVTDLLGLLGHWGGCGGFQAVPASVQSCLERYGSDLLRLEHCLCATQPDCGSATLLPSPILPSQPPERP